MSDIRRQPHQSVRRPYRVGVILDWPLATARRDALDVLRFSFEDALAARRIDRPVELLVREFDGPPLGSALDVAEAWRALAEDEQVQVILGPHTDDAALAVARMMRTIRHPTASACPVSDFSSDFGVTVGLGNAADEAVLLADLHVARGHKVALIAEATPGGQEAGAAFVLHAREAGLPVVGVARVEVSADARALQAQLLEAGQRGANAVQAFVQGLSLPALAAAAAGAAKASSVRLQMALGSGYAAHRVLEGFDRASIEGWIGIDVRDGRNTVATAFLDRFEAAKGRRPAHAYALVAHDLAQVAMHALPNAKPPSPEGVRTAMDRLRFWPSAVGSPGTSISLAPYDHRAYKGPYLVLRTIRGGEDVRLEGATRFEG